MGAARRIEQLLTDWSPCRPARFDEGNPMALDPERTKPVSEDWLRENALGRHSFVKLSPPREVEIWALRDYVRRELREEL